MLRIFYIVFCNSDMDEEIILLFYSKAFLQNINSQNLFDLTQINLF